MRAMVAMRLLVSVGLVVGVVALVIGRTRRGPAIGEPVESLDTAEV